MSIKTFLKIQTQKIFSLFNCPNSKYTWRLFQQHIREMILDQKIKFDQNYKEKLSKKIEHLHKKLSKYLPERHFDIIPTFMHIHRIVLNKYESNVLNSFNALNDAYWSFGETQFTLLQLGFKPYSLLSCSGARISYGNIGETNFIEDPELKYQRKMPDNKFSFLSITERIDKIFNKIFQKISSTLGEKVYLKFFLRRTLAGCEFGLYFDINLINSDDKIKKMKFCLIDKDPLLVFTIFLWSMAPLMAGILIFVLVYAAGLMEKIISWVYTFPEKVSAEAIKQGVITVLNLMVPDVASFFLERIISYLENVLDKQLINLDEKERKIVESLKMIFLQNDFEKTGEFISDKISSLLGGLIKIPENLGSIIKESISVALLMKIGFLLLLCLGTYISSFIHTKEKIEHAESNASSYNSTFDKNEATTVSNKNNSDKKLEEILEKEKIETELNEVPLIDDEKIYELDEYFEKVSDTYIYKFKTLNLSKFELELSDFELIETKSQKYDNYQIFWKENKINNMIYLDLHSNIKNNNLVDKIRLYGTNNHPAISHFYGFNTEGSKFDVFIEYKENGFLIGKIKQLNSTDKLIIAYGLAAALEFLHNRKIILRDFRPKNIMLDSMFYPYIFDFYSAVNVEDSNLYDTNIDLILLPLRAPELLQNPDKYSKSFPIDVYAYGMNLFHIVVGDNKFLSLGTFRLRNDILNGKRPIFPNSTPSSWINLIQKCWNQEPDQRPSFTEICDMLESNIFVNPSVNLVAVNDYMKIIKPFRPNAHNELLQ